jgi:hypothetical protein
LLITDRVIASNNDDVANFTTKLFNDGIHDTTFNVTVEIKQIITKYKVEFKVMIQKNENDKNFERELIKTTIDVGKAINGIHGNFFLRAFYENFAKSADYERKMPVKKVRKALTKI